MRIAVKLKLHSRKSELVKLETLDLGICENYTAHVQAAPVDGRANEELVGLISDYFHVRKGQVSIVSGRTSTQKIIDINL